MSSTPTAPKPASTEPAIRVMTLPRDTNAEGTIFGGVILSYIDQAGYVEAKRQAHHKYVTVHMDKVEFKQPVYVGDVLSLYAETLRIGRTSIQIKIRVMAERMSIPGAVVPVTEAETVFVAVDNAGRPTPIYPAS
jgi:acyl-CoA thioesterase YciA